MCAELDGAIISARAYITLVDGIEDSSFPKNKYLSNVVREKERRLKSSTWYLTGLSKLEM